MARIDVIIPVYNESGALIAFHGSLRAALSGLPHRFRFLYVNDGSTDDTAAVLENLGAQDDAVCAIELSRNFGHQAALSAGLDAFDADAAIMMDGDGEHPATLVPEMLRLFEMGYEVVQAQRFDAGRRGMLMKRVSGGIFYWLINQLGETRVLPGGSDYRLLSKSSVVALKQMPEYHRFFRGMVPWIGFRTAVIPYAPAQRLGGRSKNSMKKMLRLAADGIFSFSLAPLRLALIAGCGFLIIALLEGMWILNLLLHGMRDRLVPGWASLMLVSLMSSGISMVLLAILGVYIGMIFEEVKRRPVYLRTALRPRKPSAEIRPGDCSSPEVTSSAIDAFDSAPGSQWRTEPLAAADSPESDFLASG